MNDETPLALANDRWPIGQILSDLREIYNGDYELKGCWSDEEPGLAEAVAALRDKLDSRYSYLRPLGAGGSGVVLRLKDDVFPSQDVALKFPRPVLGRAQLLREMLSKEINFLAELKHPGIVRILYHSECFVSIHPGGMPYYLMEAVDGTRSDKYMKALGRPLGDSRTEAEVVDLEARVLAMLRAVLDSIRYLHEHTSGARVHLDVKPENIIVKRDGQPVMIDLGTSKQINFDTAMTVVACTRQMAAPSLARRLPSDPSDENRAHGEIPRTEIRASWDLWSYAASLLHWLGIDHGNGEAKPNAIGELLKPYTRKYLILLASRLMANEKLEDMRPWFNERLGLSAPFIKEMAVKSASAGLELIDRLIGTSDPLGRIPEMALRAVTTLQLAEGLHLPLTPRLAALLDHRALRRLDSVAQLGMVVEVYPEARHTRKEHSLGTYGWTIHYIRALYADPISPLFKQWITDEDVKDVLLAALLHDIGHFPLAHDLEDIDDDLFDHFELTKAWLKRTYRRVSVDRLQMDSLEPRLLEWDSTGERILDLLAAKAASSSLSVSGKSKLLRSIISGPIDADKMDYLVRDGDRMRLPYARGIDIERVMRSLTTVVIPKLTNGARDVPMIGVHAKGKVAAEFVSIARYAMFSQGYWHHAVRAVKAMLARAVRALVESTGDANRAELQQKFLEFAFALPEKLFPTRRSDSTLFVAVPAGAQVNALADVPQLSITDVAVLRWFEEELVREGRPESVLLSSILSRRLYKRLWVVSRDMEKRRWDAMVKTWNDLSRTQKFQLSYAVEQKIADKLDAVNDGITGLSAQNAKDFIKTRLAQRAPWLLVDIPGARPGSDVGLYYVLEGQRRRLRKDDKVAGSTEESEVWKQYAESLLQAAGKIRIFCAPELVDFVEANIPWEVGIEAISESLEAVRREDAPNA